MTDSRIKQVEALVKPQYEELRLWAHGWPHIQSVRRSSVELAQLVGVNPVLCEIAACCHDLGRVVEERADGVQTDLGNTDHSLYSIEPTAKILREVGLTGCDFGAVMGAVTVHSDRTYGGRNPVAGVLRDSDKNDALGPWGTLRCANHHFNRDLVNTFDILANEDNPGIIRELADQTLGIIKADESLKTRYLPVLDFVLEWVDNKMLDTEQAYEFVRANYDYTKAAKELLLEA